MSEKLIEIVITKREVDYYVQVKDHSEIWAAQSDVYSAVGDLVLHHNDFFRFNVVWDVNKMEVERLKTLFSKSATLIDRIDWENIMPMSRYAGGHDDQMRGLFKDVTVIGHWNEGDYQGMVATCVQLNDTGEYVIYNDYYGSCSGCDAWEDANDDEVRRMCIQLAVGAYIFKTLDDCIEFLKTPDREISYEWYSGCAGSLIQAIKNHEV